MSELELNELISRFGSMTGEERAVIVDLFTVDECLERIKKEMDHYRKIRDTLTSLVNQTDGKPISIF